MSSKPNKQQSAQREGGLSCEPADFEPPRHLCDATSASVQEISIIDNMASFLEAHGGAKVDQKVLRNMAEALSRRLNDTSPGTLQDVTMENSYGVGYRSPCVSLQQQYLSPTSPSAQGRSVREFEEQMASLRKENFNLKLRLYFIEESIPGYKQSNPQDGQESLMKQLIDSKVEMEILRKEIQEKQDILKEAAQAMNQMEEMQKETESKNAVIVEELKQKIQYFEMERDMDKSHSGDFMNDMLGRSDMSENLNALQKIRELEEVIKKYEDKMGILQAQVHKLDEVLAKRDETILEYEEKVKEIVFQNAELLESLENKEKESINAESQHLRLKLQEHKAELADKMCMLQEAEEKLQTREHIHEQACRTIQKLMLSIKNQQMEINALKTQNTSLGSNATGAKKENTEGTADGHMALECTGLCRTLGDTEAFKEISPVEKYKLEKVIEKQELTIKDLKAEVKKKTANLQNLVNKELWEKNREIERLTKLVNNTSAECTPLSPISNTGGDELQKSFSDIEYTRALERNKLLQRKVDVLIQRMGVDGSNEALISQLRKEARQARAEAEQSEIWRRECADVCATLTNRLEELAGFLNSLLKHKDVLGVLAADRRRAIRKAVDRSLDLSKSLNMTLSVSGLSFVDQSFAQLSNLSEILGEVEGAENKTFNSHEELHSGQSIETLKAENKALKKELDKRRSADTKKDRRSLPLTMLDNQSESEAWSEPDRKVSLARIGLEDHSGSLAKEVSSQHLDTDSESDALNQSRTSKARTQERISQLEQMIQQRDDRILDIQCQLVDADNRLKKENLRVLDMTHELEHLRMRNEELHTDLIAIGSQDSTNTCEQSVLLHQIEEKTVALEKAQEERERLAVEARLAEMQIRNLKEEMEEMRAKYEEALGLAAKQEQLKLGELKRDLECLMARRLSEQEEKYKETVERDWVARSNYEESKLQLTELQRQYAEAQRTIDNLNENEQELKQSLVENELTTRALKKQLDESTLQASKAVMERTKALNEKLQLDKRMTDLSQQLAGAEAERGRLQERVQQLEEQIALKIHSRLNGSDVSHSGYTSEEVPQIKSDGAPPKGGLTNAVIAGAQRSANSSSPDLGIESDAGRVSSVELSNAQRSQLRTVEFCNKHVANIKEEDAKDENMTGSNQQQAAKTPIHDCAQVEQENVDLRRKLIRTKRAFEDTYEKLRISNQKKAQIEKDIKNQILKTHNVLKNVRANMENEL